MQIDVFEECSIFQGNVLKWDSLTWMKGQKHSSLFSWLFVFRDGNLAFVHKPSKSGDFLQRLSFFSCLNFVELPSNRKLPFCALKNTFSLIFLKFLNFWTLPREFYNTQSVMKVCALMLITSSRRIIFCYSICQIVQQVFIRISLKDHCFNLYINLIRVKSIQL